MDERCSEGVNVYYYGIVRKLLLFIVTGSALLGMCCILILQARQIAAGCDIRIYLPLEISLFS